MVGLTVSLAGDMLSGETLEDLELFLLSIDRELIDNMFNGNTPHRKNGHALQGGLTDSSR